jgi:hypothetical protein
MTYMADSHLRKSSCQTAANTSKTTKFDSVARSGAVDTMCSAAYSPWINGLVEGTNKILLYVLARLCAPEVGEDGWQTMNWTDLPKRGQTTSTKQSKSSTGEYLPALKFSPKELLLSLIVNTTPTPTRSQLLHASTPRLRHAHGVCSPTTTRWILRSCTTRNGSQNKVRQEGTGVQGRGGHVRKRTTRTSIP